MAASTILIHNSIGIITKHSSEIQMHETLSIAHILLDLNSVFLCHYLVLFQTSRLVSDQSRIPFV